MQLLRIMNVHRKDGNVDPFFLREIFLNITASFSLNSEAMKKVLVALFCVVALFSCKKDDPVTGPDLFAGTYSGRITTLLTVDGASVQFSEVPTTKVIERVNGTENLVLGKGTDMEFNANVENQVLKVLGRSFSIFYENKNMTLNFLITGQGRWMDKKELRITYSDVLKIDNTNYKLTIEESLHRD